MAMNLVHFKLDFRWPSLWICTAVRISARRRWLPRVGPMGFGARPVALKHTAPLPAAVGATGNAAAVGTNAVSSAPRSLRRPSWRDALVRRHAPARPVQEQRIEQRLGAGT